MRCETGLVSFTEMKSQDSAAEECTGVPPLSRLNRSLAFGPSPMKWTRSIHRASFQVLFEQLSSCLIVNRICPPSQREPASSDEYQAYLLLIPLRFLGACGRVRLNRSPYSAPGGEH